MRRKWIGEKITAALRMATSTALSLLLRRRIRLAGLGRVIGNGARPRKERGAHNARPDPLRFACLNLAHAALVNSQERGDLMLVESRTKQFQNLIFDFLGDRRARCTLHDCPFDRCDEAPLDYPGWFGVQSTPLYRRTTAALTRFVEPKGGVSAPPFWLS